METDILEFLEKAKEEASNYSFSVGIAEEGRVISIGDDIAHVSGPWSTKLYELLLFESGDSGIAFDLDRDQIGVVILENQKGIKAGDRVYTAGTVLSSVWEKSCSDGWLIHSDTRWMASLRRTSKHIIQWKEKLRP